MTNTQINIEIAKLCGMEVVSDGIRNDLTSCDWNGVRTAAGKLLKEIPNYCEDLNAMHEAEQYLWRKDWNKRYSYVEELGKITNATTWNRMEATDMLDPSARERAEALVKTFGKWKQSSEKTKIEPYEL